MNVHPPVFWVMIGPPASEHYRLDADTEVMPLAQLVSELESGKHGDSVLPLYKEA